jgi:hypothetical protein
MDASKLRNSCICGNTVPYLECCGRYADPLPQAAQGSAVSAGTEADSPAAFASQSAAPAKPAKSAKAPSSAEPLPEGEAALHYAFRHGLHELSMALFPLRAIYQAYWEKLTKEDYPHDMLMEDPDYGRSMVENFFWDYFVQYSDARPILRTARELEGKELRLAHDLMQWSYAPLWFYRVQERTGKTAKLVNVGNGKVHLVHHAGRMPKAGDGLLTRVLPFRGREFCGHALLAFEAGTPSARLESLFRSGCRDLGVKPSVTLRPDVHCDEWRRHGSVFLALWRAEIYDSKVGRPTRGSAPAPVFNLAIRNRESLLGALGSAPEAIPAGAGIWDFKRRALRLARLEPRGGNLLVTLADPAFRAHVRDWLGERLGQAVSKSEEIAEALPGESAESQDVWIHTALDALNAQTPIQASTHDWGKRRLQLLLKDMIKQGVDVTSLRRQLGL